VDAVAAVGYDRLIACCIILALVPNHKSWGSAALTKVLRKCQKRPLVGKAPNPVWVALFPIVS
jgi:hypothetical protein